MKGNRLVVIVTLAILGFFLSGCSRQESAKPVAGDFKITNLVFSVLNRPKAI